MGRLTALKPRIGSLGTRAHTHTTATERTRGRKWMGIRAQVLSANPLCVHCLQQGRTSAATEVDHIVELADGGTDAWDNLQGLCTPCHQAKGKAESKRRGGAG